MTKGMAAKLLLAALLALAGSPAWSETPAVDFDRGVDSSALLKQARAQAAQAKAAPVKASAIRYDRDCVTFTFRPSDPLVSEAVWLMSREWVEECRWRDPRNGGGGYDCWQMPGFTHRQRVQVTLQSREPLLPWESDSFRVCLQGPWLDVDPLDTAYDYKMVQGGNRNGNIVMAPVKKIAMRPDPAGIAPESLTSALVLTLKDKWASYYAGEQTVLKLTLKKDVPNWFDATIVKREIVLPAAESYRVNFLDYAKDFSQKLEAGKKYYVAYEFKRPGKVSKSDRTKEAETGRAVYQPGSLAVGR